MRRFFINPGRLDGDRVGLPEGESRHISKVLRLERGERIELLDGEGSVYSAEIVETGKIVYARILEEKGGGAKTGPLLAVGQAMLKGKKMDTVVQKCTELGVGCFYPFVSSRCQGKLGDGQGEKKRERYQRIVEASCKQCFRDDLMDVAPNVSFHEAVSNMPGETGELKLLFWEEEERVGLHDIAFPDNPRNVSIMLGPEGGFSAEEVACAARAGWQTVSLGKRILRAETATLTAVSIVQYKLRNI